MTEECKRHLHTSHNFRSLDSLIDETHQLFASWLSDSPFGDAVSRDTILSAKIAVHEWMANLVQHARFEGFSPRISLSVWSDKSHLCVRIEDNSDGFSLDRRFSGSLQQAVATLPERGMGLLILKEAADKLIYERKAQGALNGISVAVRAVDAPAEDTKAGGVVAV